MVPKYPFSLRVYMDNKTSVDAEVNSPEQATHWMMAFMADDWLELRWSSNGKLTQVVKRNPADRFDPLISEVT